MCKLGGRKGCMCPGRRPVWGAAVCVGRDEARGLRLGGNRGSISISRRSGASAVGCIPLGGGRRGAAGQPLDALIKAIGRSTKEAWWIDGGRACLLMGDDCVW